MLSHAIVDIISKVSPIIGASLGGPAGGFVASLVSKALGSVDMTDMESVTKAISKPEAVDNLKQLELQLTDLQNARNTASKEQGGYRLVRPILAIVAMLAIVADIVAIQYTTNTMLSQILITMLVVLVWDVRQIYKFYFGSSDDLPNMGFKRK